MRHARLHCRLAGEVRTVGPSAGCGLTPPHVTRLAAPRAFRHEGWMRILLVEDNPDLGEAVENRLRKSGHSVEWVRDGLAAAEAAGHDSFDAVLLDIMLPGQDGFAVLRDLRRRGVDAPVLVVTARSEIDDKVGILDLGADDYLVKPFDLRELEARLRALLRRPAGQTSSTVSHGNVTLDLAGRAVTVA